MTSAENNYPITTDWVDTLNAWRDVFAPLRPYQTQERIADANYITNEKVATYRLGPCLVELSTGLFPELGVRPRVDQRLFGVTVRARHNDEQFGYGHCIDDAKTMPEVLARFWDHAMTGLAFHALVAAGYDLANAEAVLMRWFTGTVFVDDAVRMLPAALDYAREYRLYAATTGEN